MFRPTTRPHRRRGTSFILIVVIMCSIMAAVGIAFALFAMQIAKVSVNQKVSQGGDGTTPLKAPDPTDTINTFFGSLIFDRGDDSYEDLTNALRGHSFAASMWGRRPGNTTAWDGVGPFHEDGSYGYADLATLPAAARDRARFVNFTQMSLPNSPIPYLLDPEWTGPRAPAGGPWPASFAASLTGRALVGKNAGYSYPGVKDFFLAQVDPATGEVLVPSFHRDWLFGTTGPTNGNWYNAHGKLLTPRPRPAEHPNFPRVPQNLDGTYTGDVQNWFGGASFVPGFAAAASSAYHGRPDSYWMNLNLPTVPFGKKRVQPLVAPLIVPLSALFNASAHGNTFGNWAHLSYAGYGPWEVNIAPGLLTEADRQAIIGINPGTGWTGRGPRQQRNGLGTRAYDPYGGPGAPNYAPVAWNGTAVAFPAYPLNNNLLGRPDFFPAVGPFQFGNGTVGGHPALFNPTEWPASTTFGFNRTYPLGDIKRLNFRHAFAPDWYGQSDLGPTAQTSLGGSYAIPGTPAPFGFNAVPAAGTPHAYRNDPTHPNRALFTSRSFELDRPKITPNFLDRSGNNGLQYGTGPGGPYKSGVVSPGPYPAPQALPANAITDFAPANASGSPQWYNLMARLGSVNLNRPLADYRSPLTQNQPLSATNMGNIVQAESDRRQLAKDIFVRFVAALGAGVIVDPATGNYSIPATLSANNPSQFKAARYLAQLAVNIVDYIDNDDISTVWIWNPDPLTGTADFTSLNDVDERVVIGTERTRLVINEMYSEIVNDPGDNVNNMANPAGRAHVRFWCELLNPTTTPNPGHPTNDGSVSLSAYRIEIRRANRQTGVAAINRDANGSVQRNYLFGTNGVDNVNVTGGFERTAGAPDAVFTFPATPAANTPGAVGPNNGQYAPAAVTLPANGFVLVGPPAAQRGDDFSPNGAPWTNNLVTSGAPAAAPGSTAMGYQTDLPAAALATTEYKQHIVLLRRLANPHLPAGPTNPYVTVDLMDYVPSFDAIAKLANQGANRNPRAAMNANPNGYDPTAERFSVGKVQPYAGHAAATISNVAGAAGYNTYTYPTSMVLPQTVANTNAPNHTFGRHNGTHAGTVADPLPAGSSFIPTDTSVTPPSAPRLTDTIQTPFDWLVHMDRPLVNQAELFQVRDTPPHLVTDRFVVPFYQNPIPPAPAPPLYQVPGLYYEAGYGNWRAIHDGLGRAFELLSVKPHTAGVAHGGRGPGKININALQDRRILQGLLDPQAGNGFDMDWVNNTAWARWLATRTPVETRFLADGTSQVFRAQAAQGALNEGFGNDRPFMSFGAPAAAGGSTFAYGAGGNIDQTILRRVPAAVNPPPFTPPPYLYTNAASRTPPSPVSYPASQPDGPSYYQAEAVRKMMNNTTQVNHLYLVVMTIGYFEVDGLVSIGNGQSIPRVGPEVYLNVVGDARQQVIAVVDMSNMAMKPVFPAYAGDTNPQAGSYADGRRIDPPFFTSLEQNAYVPTPIPPGFTAALKIAYSRHDASGLYVAADGVEVPVGGSLNAASPPVLVGNQLVLGYGTEEQVVTVAGVGNPTIPSEVGVVFVTGMTRTAWAGSSVSNVRPGYPGPQPGFKYDDPAYAPVLPYIERLR